MAQRNVNATIGSVQATPQGWVIEARIPSISPNYKVKLSRVPDHLAGQLKPGHSYDLTVQSENLKKDKFGAPYNGEMPFHYYWGLVSLGVTEGVPEISPPMPTNHVGFEDGAQMDTGVSQPKPSFDAGGNRNRSIERQVALKAAVEIQVRAIEKAETMAEVWSVLESEQVITRANLYADWMAE